MRKLVAGRIIRIANRNADAFKANLRPANHAYIRTKRDARIGRGGVVEILEGIDRLIGFGIDGEEVRDLDRR